MMVSTGKRKSGLASESALALPAGLACEGSRFSLLLPVEFILGKQSEKKIPQSFRGLVLLLRSISAARKMLRQSAG